MIMGNAVRLARKKTENCGGSDRTLSVDWPNRLDGRSVISHAVLSGKKIQFGEKSEVPSNQTAKYISSPIVQKQQSLNKHGDLPICLENPKVMDVKITFPKDKQFINDVNIDKNRTNIEQNHLGINRIIQPHGSPQPNPESSNGNSKTPEVRYIVLQPGQKIEDLELLTHRPNSERNATHISPQILYAPQQLAFVPGTSTLVPIHRDIGDVRADVNGSPILPSLGTPDTSFPQPLDLTDRAKDVVPGTQEKYRTPGSSFLNKNGNIKRPMNAFMVWARTYRSELATRNQGDTNSQISVKLGDIWNTLSQDEKQPFYEEAERIKREHKKEFPGWVYRPAASRKRHDDNPTHQVLWARFSEGSSSAALAAMANAAANNVPFESIQVKQEPAKNVTPGADDKKTTGVVSNGEVTVRKEQAVPMEVDDKEQTTSGHKEQTSSGAIENSERAQGTASKSATLKGLKAKIAGQTFQGLECRKIVAKEKPDSAKAKTKASRSRQKLATQEDSLGTPKKPTKAAAKKKKQKNPGVGIERREEERYMLDLRSRSPTTPPSTPTGVHLNAGSRDVHGVDSKTPNSARNTETRDMSGYRCDSDWMTSPEDDEWGLLNKNPGPFRHLSPRDVPSDDILGSRRLARESSENLARPEKVTSDIYLNLNGWHTLLASSDSETRLTDEAMGSMLGSSICEHGLGCRICTSDMDLSHKPISQTLLLSQDLMQHPHDYHNVCEEVVVETEPEVEVMTQVRKDSVAQLQTQSKCKEQNVVVCDSFSRGFSPLQHVEDEIVVNSSDSRLDTDEGEISSLGVEVSVVDWNSESCGSECDKFLDVDLSTTKTTHVVFKGDKDGSSILSSADESRSGSDMCGGYKHTCVGCSLNIDDLRAFAKISAEIDEYALSSMSDTDESEASTRHVEMKPWQRRPGRPRTVGNPNSAHIYRTDVTSGRGVIDQSARGMTPDVIPLQRNRPMTAEGEQRCEMYHRRLQPKRSEHRLFDSNRSAKPARATRLKSAQLARDGQSMKLGVFGEETKRKGVSLSVGNLNSRSRVDIDDLEGVEGTGMSMSARADSARGVRKSPQKKVAFAAEDGRKTRGRKSAKKSSLRKPEDGDSNLCQGDSLPANPNPSIDRTQSPRQMELLKTLLEKDKRGSDADEYDHSAHARLSRRQARSQMTSKIYVSSTPLPNLSRGKPSPRSYRVKTGWEK